MNDQGREDLRQAILRALDAAADSVLHHHIERDGWNKDDECYRAKMLKHADEIMALTIAGSPAWKAVSCPICGAQVGESCGRERTGVPWQWQRVAPHVARKRLAEKGPA